MRLDKTGLVRLNKTHMYVMEHVRMEISKEGSVRLRDSRADTIRATDNYYE